MVKLRSLVFLALLSVLAVACTSEAPQPTAAPKAAEPAPSVSTSVTPELSIAPELAEPAPAEELDPKRYTFVLIGGDLDYLGRDIRAVERGAFIIVTGVFPKDGPGDIVIIDVPRDLYVPISCQDGALDRIVSAYPHGLQAGGGEVDIGLDCVRQVVEDNFGLEVNSGAALVAGHAFESLVDSFGGLTITPRSDHTARCSKHENLAWVAGETYDMDGDALKCYVKMQSNGAGRDQDRAFRAEQTAAAMAGQWLPLYVEHPVQSVTNTWDFWKQNVVLSLNLAEVLRLAPLIPKAQDAEIRSASFRQGEDIADWTTPQGTTGLRSLVDLREWTACTVASPLVQEQTACSATVLPSG